MTRDKHLPHRRRAVRADRARPGPWDPQALHGGAPAALIAAAFERVQPGADLQIARLGFELLRPIPLAPLTLATGIVRPGRRVQELAATLSAEDPRTGEQQVICRASALRVQAVPRRGGRRGRREQTVEAPQPTRCLGPSRRHPCSSRSMTPTGSSFAASSMEMRWLSDPEQLGPGRVWMRLRHPLVPGQELTALARLAATADFGNGIGAALPFNRFLFINADLSIHLQRAPRGEWIGLDALTLLHDGGSGLAESVLHDVHGPVGRAFQTLVVQAR